MTSSASSERRGRRMVQSEGRSADSLPAAPVLVRGTIGRAVVARPARCGQFQELPVSVRWAVESRSMDLSLIDVAVLPSRIVPFELW